GRKRHGLCGLLLFGSKGLLVLFILLVFLVDGRYDPAGAVFAAAHLDDPHKPLRDEIVRALVGNGGIVLVLIVPAQRFGGRHRCGNEIFRVTAAAVVLDAVEKRRFGELGVFGRVFHKVFAL